MNRRNLMAWTLVASLAALPAFAGELSVTNAWSRTTPPGVTVGVAYFTLKNDTGKSDRLLKISSPIASKAQVHRTEILDGIARMREVAVLHVDAGQTLEFCAERHARHVDGAEEAPGRGEDVRDRDAVRGGGAEKGAGDRPQGLIRQRPTAFAGPALVNECATSPCPRFSRYLPLVNSLTTRRQKRIARGFFDCSGTVHSPA